MKTNQNRPKEAVNHPSHYRLANGRDVIDYIEAFDLGFSLGNALKYRCRAGRKDPRRTDEDLRKADWYIAREAARTGVPARVLDALVTLVQYIAELESRLTARPSVTCSRTTRQRPARRSRKRSGRTRRSASAPSPRPSRTGSRRRTRV